MRGSRSSAKKPWTTILEYKRDLILRDPLGLELTRRLIKYWSAWTAGSDVSATVHDLKRRIIEKYELEDLDLPAPVGLPALQAAGWSEEQLAGVLWSPLGLASPISMKMNWIQPGQVVISRQAGVKWLRPGERPQPPPGQAPTLTFTVATKAITQRDLARLARHFKNDVVEAAGSLTQDLRPRGTRAKGAPPALRASSVPTGLIVTVTLNPRGTLKLSELEAAFTRRVKEELRRPSKSGRVPGPLAFLHTVSDKIYRRDLARYDRHVKDGLTYRQIAFVEVADRRGVSGVTPPQSLGDPVLGEDSVERSVRRIHEAIQPGAYRARERRLGAETAILPEFSCPTHGRDCPENCSYLKNWSKGAAAILPTDGTGRPGRRLLAEWSERQSSSQ